MEPPQTVPHGTEPHWNWTIKPNPNNSNLRSDLPMALFIPALLLVLVTPAWTACNPHQPLNLTWQLLGPRGNLVKQITRVSPPGVWFPDIVFDLCEIAGPDWLESTGDLGCSRKTDTADRLRRASFYVCPGWNRSWQCGGREDYFCKKWGCESTGHIWWKAPVTTDLITLHREPDSVPTNPYSRYPCNILHSGPTPYLCNPVRIVFTDQGKKATGWDRGKMWGIRVYEGSHTGTLFTLRLVATVPTPPEGQNPQEMGPSETLDQLAPPLPRAAGCPQFINNLGIVRESLAKLRERLDKRKMEYEQTQGWFKYWWLTILIPVLLGFLVIFILLVTLWAFIRKRSNTAQLTGVQSECIPGPGKEAPPESGTQASERNTLSLNLEPGKNTLILKLVPVEHTLSLES